MSAPRLYNRTRQTPSLPAKLRQQGRWLELPLYHLLRQSDLAREGMENSGSYRFADHIYRGVPSGRGWVGSALDRMLLTLPAVRSFRNRYLAARDELAAFLVRRASSGQDLHIVSAPCGLPRELVEAARIAEQRAPGCLRQVCFHGLDLDERVLRDAARFAAEEGLPNFVIHQGDALNRESYPEHADFITSTGLAEFLDDNQLEKLYTVFHQVLRPEGQLFTSGMRRLPLSDYLLELAELHTHYRLGFDLKRLAHRAGFRSCHVSMDELSIQSFLMAGP